MENEFKAAYKASEELNRSVGVPQVYDNHHRFINKRYICSYCGKDIAVAVK